MGVDSYSETAASNATTLGVNIGEGCDPGNVNDAIRQLAADFATFLNWKEKTAAYTLVAYDVIQADTVTTGAFTATLPTSPSTGHWVRVVASSSWASNNLTIGRGGSTIRGVASDLVLSDAIGASYAFYFDGTTWQYTNAYLSLAGGQMTGTLKEAKGADIASATALTLGSDGNSFDVTGTTTITSIGTVGVGTHVTLQFDGALILTHHATDLILPSGANITTAAGDIAKFYEYASGDWRCISYTKADGTALVGGADFSAVAEDIIPDADSTRDLGTSSKLWAEVHADKVLTPLLRIATESADRSVTGIAAGFLHMDMTGPTVNDSLNVSSVSDDGTGKPTVNFTSNFASISYVVSGASTYRDGSTDGNVGDFTLRRGTVNALTVSAAKIATTYHGNFGDFQDTTGVFHGDLA